MKIKSLTEIDAVRQYLNRVGAEPRSMKSAVIQEPSGQYWKDKATIRFNPQGEVSCSTLEHAPTESEQEQILKEWAKVEFPQLKMLHRITNAPDRIREADPKNVFEFRTLDGSQIIMVQVRIELTTKEGERKKGYLPFTYWDDDEWRQCEPDGELPLWGLDQLKDHKTVFIHEGAKAAAHCRWMAEGKTKDARDALAAHPWGNELVGAAHVGWIGGAKAPNRTNWSIMHRNDITRAYLVSDNDEEGRSAITAISKALRMVVMSVEFNDRFPKGFDLGDRFPDAMFAKTEGKRFYTGPSMRTLMNPATWATDVLPNPAGTGRPITRLREPFKHMWAYVEEADVFVCKEMPDIIRSESIFNKLVAAFSDVQETSRLVVKSYKGRSTRLCYRPDQKGLVVDFRGSSAINLHIPSEVRAVQGDPSPWIEFLKYMFPHDNERKEVERWCATLIAKPATRMSYGLLLVSETQGIGKTTLGEHILGPLVGVWNVGFPAEKDITSDFNEWVAHKRLAIVNEIYSGSSWRAYNALKSVITDHSVTVNQKYMRQYIVDNWCHVVACSNSMRALKMEHDDRRWFYPEVTERPWPGKKFVEFRAWVEGGGLNIIRSWAEGYGEYVHPNERAPMTLQKQELIEGSRSDAQEEAAALAQLLVDNPEPAALLMKDVVGWVRSSAQGRVFDSDYELRRAMTTVGVHPYKKRIKVAGRLQYALINEALLKKLESASEAEEPGLVRDSVLKAQSLMESEM
ncbi:MAG TPA: primase-helicase family protein [Acidimicrobiia bacterium]